MWLGSGSFTALTFDDAAATKEASFTPTVGEWYRVAVGVKRASSAVASDGKIQLYAGNDHTWSLRDETTGIDNYDQLNNTFDYITIGATHGMSTVDGETYTDQVQLSDSFSLLHFHRTAQQGHAILPSQHTAAPTVIGGHKLIRR